MAAMTSFLLVVRAGPLDPGTAAEVRDLAADAAATDGVDPLSEQPLLGLTAPGPTTHLLARDPAGTLAGYAQLDLGAPGSVSAELVVAPWLRRRGVGDRLLAAGRAIATDDRSAGPDGRRYLVWAHGDLPAARALAARAGLAVVRELWLMTADLTTVPAQGAPPLPAGVTVRPFVPGQDEEAWRRVNSRAFAHHPEQGRLSRQDLQARLAESWFDPAGFLLAERDGVLLGSVWTKVHPTHRGGGPVGEIYVVGADPDAQGMGLGGALTRRGLEYMLGRGLTRAILYTDAGNDVAIRAYTRAGFVRTGVDVQFG
jgi:mycothiol synthase